jgi:3-hydroxyisobutyrate dehydrogenase-like beta-hydroxyacid dehydrogenase
MSEVSVIGLGNMGSALARVLLENGRAVTVWNRSPEKATSLVEKGAALAPNVDSAIAASPLIIVCVTNYAASNRILGEAANNLSGKLLVQFTTGTPQDARTNEAWAHEHGAEYLDCAIAGGQVYRNTRRAHPDFRQQGGISKSGTDPATAGKPGLQRRANWFSAWDMAMLMRFYGMFLSLFHSVQICQAEGIPLEEYITLLGKQGKNYEKWLCENIQSGNYQETSAPLELWAGAIQNIARHAQECDIHAEFPMLAAGLFQKAVAARYGREEVSAVFKVL